MFPLREFLVILMERYHDINKALKHFAAVLTVSFLPAFIDASPPAVFAEPLIPPGYAPTTQVWEGIASYYSVDGCLGCSPNLHMANGEPLRDENLTLAFMRAPLNSMVLVTNMDNDLSVVAKVTDRGGFEPYGRIADLSLGLKNAIGGRGLTPVQITLLEELLEEDERFNPSNRGELETEEPVVEPEPEIQERHYPTQAI